VKIEKGNIYIRDFQFGQSLSPINFIIKNLGRGIFRESILCVVQSNLPSFFSIAYFNEKIYEHIYEMEMILTFDNEGESSSLQPRFRLILRILSLESAPIQVLQELL